VFIKVRFVDASAANGRPLTDRFRSICLKRGEIPRDKGKLWVQDSWARVLSGCSIRDEPGVSPLGESEEKVPVNRKLGGT